MNTGTFLRKASKPLYEPIGRLFAKTGIHPNIFSLLALVWAAIGVYTLYKHQEELALILFVISALWDIFDGTVARTQNRTSEFGYYIEGIIDKWGEIIIALGFFLYGYQLESFALISATLMMSFVKPRAAMVTNIGEFDWPAIGARQDRLFLILASFTAHIVLGTIEIEDFTINILSVGMYITAGLVFIGQIQRIFFAKKIIDAGGVDNMEIEERER